MVGVAEEREGDRWERERDTESNTRIRVKR